LDRKALWTASVVFYCGLGFLVIALSGPVFVLVAAGWLGLLTVMALRVGYHHLGFPLAVTAVLSVAELDVVPVPPEVRWAGVPLVLIAISPFVIRPLRSTVEFPFVHLFTFLTLLYTVLAVLFANPERILAKTLDPEVRVLGLLLAALFLLVVVVVGLLVPRRRELGPVAGDVNIRLAVGLVIVSYAGTFALSQLGLSDALGQFTTAVALLRTAGYVALWYAWLQRKLPWPLAVFGAAGVLFDVMSGIGTTLLYAGMATPIAALCLYVALRRRVPWGIVLVACCAALLLNAVKGDVRQESRQSFQTEAELERAVELTSRGLSSENLSADSFDEAARRFSYTSADILGYVASVVPSEYPYWDKSTYRFLPVAPIPRVLVPWKPQATFGNQFGREYDLLLPSDLVTSANLPVSADAFVNFGVAGLLGAGVATGLMLGVASRWIRPTSPRGFVLGALLAEQFLKGIESDSTIMLGGVVTVLVVFVPLTRWLTLDDPAVRDGHTDEAPTQA
jgi:hypothetical protein